jgi:ADP-ribosylglycohydrolase
MLCFISKLFNNTNPSCALRLQQVQGFFVGGAIGEALALPVRNKSKEEILKNPVTELLGFGDFQTPAGFFAECTQATLDFAKFLCDNAYEKYTPERFFYLCNQWYILKAKDEEHRLRVILPCAALSGIFYSSMKKDFDSVFSSIPDLLSDEAIAPAVVVFCVFKNVSEGKSLEKSCKIAKKSLKKVLKKIGLVINSANISLKILKLLMHCATATNSYQAGVLDGINQGENTDLTGNLLGNLLGLFYGLENIPYIWKKFLVGQDNFLKTAEQIAKLNYI